VAERRSGRASRAIVLASSLALALLAIAPGATTAADMPQGSLAIQPSVVKVTKGSEFSVQVIQDAPVATSGAQASVLFDPSILQIESVTTGDPYAGAPFLLPKDFSGNVARANETGRLAQVAVAFLPPTAVQAGPAVFLVVTFRVVGCGATQLDLPVGPFDAQMIDGRQDVYGYPVGVSAAGAEVTTCVSAAEATSNDALTNGSLGSAPPAAAGDPPASLLAALVAFAVAGILAALAWRARRQDRAQ
jgi:hypothetical protein